MKASLVKLKNILGISELEFRLRPQGVTVLAGANGKGKTSVLSALAGVVKGGHDATLLRRGAKEGEIVIELDDGTVLAEKVSADASKLTAKTKAGRVTAVKRWLDSIVQRETFDLVAFLRAPAAERIKLLLRAMPIDLPAEVKEIAEETGVLLPQEVHPLEVISRLEKAIYDQRTGVNRSAKDKRSTVAELAGTIAGTADVAQLEADHATLTEHLRKVDILQADAIQAATREEDEKKGEILEKAAAIAGEIEAEFDRALEEVNAALATSLREIDEQIAALRERRATVVANMESSSAQNQKDRAAELLKLEQRRIARIEEIAEARRIRVDQAKADHARESADVRERLARVVEQQRNAASAAATKAIVDRTTKEAGVLEAQADDLTSALDQLSVVRGELANDLPIKGLSVVDGEIHMNGVPFGRLSGAERVGLAFEIARACLAGLPDGLRFVVVDGAECLDEEHFAALEKAAAGADVQVLCTRVDEGALRVEGGEGA